MKILICYCSCDSHSTPYHLPVQQRSGNWTIIYCAVLWTDPQSIVCGCVCVLPLFYGSACVRVCVREWVNSVVRQQTFNGSPVHSWKWWKLCPVFWVENNTRYGRKYAHQQKGREGLPLQSAVSSSMYWCHIHQPLAVYFTRILTVPLAEPTKFSFDTSRSYIIEHSRRQSLLHCASEQWESVSAFGREFTTKKLLYNRQSFYLWTYIGDCERIAKKHPPWLLYLQTHWTKPAWWIPGCRKW